MHTAATNRPARSRRMGTTAIMTLVLLGLVAVPVLAKGKGKGAGNSARPAKYDGQYSLEVQALKGPDATDVSVTVVTSDAAAWPVPDELKKLQVKITDEDDDVVFIVNEKGAGLDDGHLSRSVAEPAPHTNLRILATIDTGPRTVVLKQDAEVLMRPDLVVTLMSNPDEVKVNEAFNVDIDVRELNGEVGTTATVSLLADGNLLGSVQGVTVNAGGVTTVVFAAITFADEGTKTLTAVISDADPAEFDDSNNEATSTITVTSDVEHQDTWYYLSYSNYDNYYYNYWDNYCGQSNYGYQYGSYDYLYVDGYAYGDTPSGSIDEITWSVSTENGVVRSGSISGLTPYYSASYPGYYTYEYYQHVDQATGTHLYVYAYDYDPTYYPTDYTYFYYYQYSGEYVYVYNYNSGTTVYHENWGTHMNAHSTITATVTIEDDGILIGGQTAPTPITYQRNDYTYSYSGNSSCGPYSYFYEYHYDYYWGYSSGYMTPPAAAKPVAVAALPSEVELGGNRPNPFNPSTTIEFALPTAADITLEVYDVLGRRVATVVEGFHRAGRHQVEFDGSQLSSGTYFYRLTAPDFQESRKLQLIK